MNFELAREIFQTTKLHFIISIILSLSLFFLDASTYRDFASFLEPAWPLLNRSHIYMEENGHLAAYWYMSAIYFKDLLLAVLFFSAYVLAILRAEVRANFKRKGKVILIDLGIAIVYLYPMFLLVRGPLFIPPHTGDISAVNGSLFELFLYTWTVPPALGLFFFLICAHFMMPTDDAKK